MWKSTAWVTSLPFEYTVSRSVPWLCTMNGNGQAPAGSVNVRSIVVIVVTGWSAAAVGASATSASTAITTTPLNDHLFISVPSVSHVSVKDADVRVSG